MNSAVSTNSIFLSVRVYAYKNQYVNRHLHALIVGLNSMLMWDLTFVQVISITLNDLPIDWLPIVHNNEYISQGSSLPFLFSFQIHHTVATRKKKQKGLRKFSRWPRICWSWWHLRSEAQNPYRSFLPCWLIAVTSIKSTSPLSMLRPWTKTQPVLWWGKSFFICAY